MKKVVSYDQWKRATKYECIPVESLIEEINSWLLESAPEAEPEILQLSCILSDKPILPATKKKLIKLYTEAGWPKVTIRLKDGYYKIIFDQLDILINNR